MTPYILFLCLDWSSWAAWETCSASACGGQQSRTRSCLSCGEPSEDCSGSSTEARSCNTQGHPGKVIRIFYPLTD